MSQNQNNSNQQNQEPKNNFREKIKLQLYQALEHIEDFEECALLDYHGNRNIGDHLIWLGTIFYLSKVRKIRIKYTAGASYFSEKEMEKYTGNNTPILLHGGGNLGDI